jgi:hypothetical protein
MKPRYYDCGICGHNHPWDWDGDCREDANRFTDMELDAKHGQDGYELASMDERVAADEADQEDAP